MSGGLASDCCVLGKRPADLIEARGNATSPARAAAIFAVPLGMLLAFSTWFLTNAVAPGLEAATGVSQAVIVQLTNGVQGGFILGTVGLATTGLADLLPAQLVFGASAVAAGAVNACLLFPGVTVWSMAAIRVLTGISLAGVYPIGMKMLFSSVPSARGLALGVAVGALALGSGLPHLFAASFAAAWQPVVATSSALSACAGIAVALVGGRDEVAAPAAVPTSAALSPASAPLPGEAAVAAAAPAATAADADSVRLDVAASPMAASLASPTAGQAGQRRVQGDPGAVERGSPAAHASPVEEGAAPTRGRSSERCGGVLALWQHVPSRLAFLGYIGHMVELYAAWTSFAPLLVDRLASGLDGAARTEALATASLVTFGAFAAGAVASPVAGIVADRWLGRSLTTVVLMALSGSTALWVGFVTSPAAVIAGVLLYGATIVPDSPQFSTAIGELAPPERRGAMLSVSTGLGFLVTMITIATTSLLQAAWGWGPAIALLAAGPAVGIVSMLLLYVRPEAQAMAGGRR
ncbi:hypothetical protein FNF31_02923 [Cafeteria roenbergensis]|uniref:Major facilitator superfamily (MFS) profile domain-containing protein n=4 Tax=Cafeteria roenbergensis TaxID=33653 RepID=A0A5A8DG00_CAFRO|nr:hypothetical protein FNF31_02923 [Cafeteria roenbergensis]